jgi:chorismate synthase
MQDVVDEAMKSGDTVGGVFEVRAAGVPPGLGSYTHWDRRLDGRLAQAVMSIPAVKCVQIGSLDADQRSGSEYHDPIWYDDQRQEFRRRTNHAGGVEGGVSNGEEIVVRGRLKPIPTLRRPLMSVDIVTKAPCTAQYERSDTCVVPAAGVVGEAVVCIVLAQALQEKCGGDSLAELRSGLDRCRQSMSEL